MSNEEQNGFFANTLLAAVPIVSTHLEDKYGFECKVDYDKDFATDEYYSLKIATYKKKIVGNLEIHITDSFKFVEAPDTYKYQSTTVEIVQGTEFQEIKIDKMWPVEWYERKTENLPISDVVGRSEQYHCELHDFGRKDKRCDKQCDGCKAMNLD